MLGSRSDLLKHDIATITRIRTGYIQSVGVMIWTAMLFRMLKFCFSPISGCNREIF